MEIILAKDNHVPEIVELWKELADYLKNLDLHWSRRQDGHLNFEKHVRDLLNDQDACILVVREKGKVVGFTIAQIGKYPPEFEWETYGSISDMIVTSGYRRKRIGEQMLGKILGWFTSRGIDRIELSVAAKNQVGYSFWKKHGFRDYMHRLYLDRG